ncbi:MAG: hypothetical protein EOM23_03720, partial [Candidatus Moranbacteria bacterium]|nr:hypothetical protein [Candidatus Moranbacteria bacterium]
MFWRLFRLFYKENFSFKRFLGFDYKKERIKSVLIIAAILYALLAFIGSFGYMFFDLGKMLLAMNQLHIIISFITAYAISIAIMFVLFRADGMIFHYQDYDILAPLPINTRVVLGAKIAVLYLMTTILTILISLPMAFAYFYFSGFHILSFISYVVGLLVLPLIPIVLMSFVSLLIKTISNKFKYSKLISIFLVFAVFIGFFIWSFSMADVEQNPLTGQIDLLATLSRFYLPRDWYMRAVHQREVLPLLYLISSHLLIFGIYFLGIGPLVNHTNQNQTSMRLSKTNKTVKYQTRSIYSSLLAKEFRKFFSVTIYAVNAGLGPVILIVLSVASLFYRNEISGFMTEMVGFDLKI